MKKHNLEYLSIFVLINSLKAIFQGLFDPLLNILNNLIRSKILRIDFIDLSFLNSNILIQMRLDTGDNLAILSYNTFHALKTFPHSLIKILCFIRVRIGGV